MSSKLKVFLTRRIPDAGLALLRDRCELSIWPGPLPPPAGEIRERVANCAGLVALLTDPIDAGTLDRAPHLRVISNFAVGFDNIDVKAATARGIPVGNTPDVLTDATADMAMCLLLAAARRLPRAIDDARAGTWQTWDPLGYLGQELSAKTLGIVGLGRIGCALARRCHAGWNMRILYSGPHEKPQANRDLHARRVPLNTLLGESDFVSLHAGQNDQTRGLFCGERFRLMKPSAVFINTARGALVNQADLIEALTRGTIFAAGIDVTDPEPPSRDDPVLHVPNLIVAPHIASATTAAREGMARICAGNILAGLRGDHLPACVNPEVYDKPSRLTKEC